MPSEWWCVIILHAGLDFRTKSDSQFLWNGNTLWPSDSQLRIIIRNIFAFLYHIPKTCVKRGNLKFCLKKKWGPKKKVFWWCHFKSDSQISWKWFAICDSFCQSDLQLLQKWFAFCVAIPPISSPDYTYTWIGY